MEFTSTGDPLNPHGNVGNKKPILYLDPLLSVLSAMEDTGDTWLGGYPVEVKFITYLSLTPFATFQVIFTSTGDPLNPHGNVGNCI